MTTNQHAQDSKIPRFERWNLRNLGWNLGQNPFTDATASCYIAGKPRGPVLETTKKPEVATPTVKRGFVMPKFLGLVRPRAQSLMVTGGMGISARTATRLVSWFQHPVHLLRLKPQKVATLIQPGIQTMTVISQASRRAAPSPTAGTPAPICPPIVHGLSLTDPRCAEVLNALPGMADPVRPTAGTLDPIQLHADARNALSMAIFYLRQPEINVPGARRKAIQALAALRGLDLSAEA